MNNSINNFKMETIETDYKLALLTYYTTINNKLNGMTGDTRTLENVKKLVDEEMGRIITMINCRVLTVNNNEEIKNCGNCQYVNLRGSANSKCDDICYKI